MVEEYRVHGASAFHGKHEPELRRAMADMSAGRITVLVVWKSDRIDRQEKLGALINEARSYGGRIEFVTEPELNALSGLGGRVMTTVKEWVNAEESRTKSDRVKAKHDKLRRLGSFATGRAPYGYSIVPAGTKEGIAVKTLVPNESAPIVRRIFEDVAKGITLGQLARALSDERIPTRVGKAVWGESSVAQIIANDAYRGIVRDPQGKPYMTVGPLVSSAIWVEANRQLNARARIKGHGTKGRPQKYLLRPVCGNCGGPMYYYALAGRTSIYRCAGFGPSGNSAQRKGCGNTIASNLLDAEVTEAFESADDVVIEETVIPGTDYAEEIAKTQLAVKDLDVMADDYDEAHAALMTELRRLKALPIEPPRVEARPVFNEAGALMLEGDAFKAMNPEERRAFIRQWVLTVFPKESSPRWKLSGGPGTGEGR
jgi:DNA invertase Pin-like site-specific DNA recombinase